VNKPGRPPSPTGPHGSENASREPVSRDPVGREGHDRALASPTLGELFAGFLFTGLSGFGGVLPWARRMVVEQRRWLSGPEFTDLLALCQFLPGPNVLNLAVTIGARFAGTTGAIVASLGLMAAPMVIVIVLGMIHARYGHLAWVEHGFGGLAAAASGLVLSMAVKISAPLRTRPAGAAMAAVTFLAIAVLRVPLLPAMLLLAPVSVAVCAITRP
jgi:chromate transporter